jgi:membrane-bound ClpP family serine protease
VRAGLLLLALAVACGAFVSTSGRAQEAGNDGLVVQIPTLITTEATNRLRTSVFGPLKRFEAEREAGKKGRSFRLVCDFNPDNRTSASDDFGACLKLAKYLGDLQKEGVQTVAFVHGEVSRHSVLPVLACSQIVMSSDPPARIGRVVDQGGPLDELERLAYKQTAEQNRYPKVIVQKMYDRNVAVVKVKPGPGGERYLDGGNNPPPDAEPVHDLERGATALYSVKQAKEFGLCQPQTLNSLDEVLAAYRLPRTGLFQSLDRPAAWRVVVAGTLNGELREKTQRRVRQALAQKANLLILQLECGDGESQSAYELALFLTELNQDRTENPVETIAFVTGKAGNTATFLAFACDKIVMEAEVKQGDVVVRAGGRLGDFDRFLKGRPQLEAVVRRNLVDIAAKRYYPQVIAEGMLSRELRIHEVVSIKGDQERRFLSEEQLEADRKSPEPRWRSAGLVKPATKADEGQYLTLSAQAAKELGIATAVVPNLEALYELEGLNPAEVRLAEADWLDSLADFLRDPMTSVVLVMLGVTCLILELKMPGVTFPGVIAAICFVLFFWSHSQLNGQITMLALLLFLLGLILIGLEVFVLPGFGVAGLSGVVLVVGSLGLVAYGHWPRTNEEWVGFGHKLGPFGLSILAALAAALALVRYLPHLPYANRLLLKPQTEEDEVIEGASGHPYAELAGLLGAIGVAATPLRPAGKVQFGDEFVDVVAEGGYVQPGTRVQVIEIEGNRVVVKEV